MVQVIVGGRRNGDVSHGQGKEQEKEEEEIEEAADLLNSSYMRLFYWTCLLNLLAQLGMSCRTFRIKSISYTPNKVGNVDRPEGVPYVIA